MRLHTPNLKPKAAFRILGIDPGYEKIGVAVIEKNHQGREVLLFSDCITTKKDLEHHKRLSRLGKEIEKVIKVYKPSILSIEKLFFNENQKTAMKVSEARGTLLYVASCADMEIREFTPLQIKTAITGYGRADKKQMMAMLPKLISIAQKVREDDEYDAIAAALTASATFSV